MRTLTALATTAILLGTSLTAVADGTGRAEVRPQAISAPALLQQIDALGYDVLRLRARDGSFETRMAERSSGGIVRATFDAATGELLRASPGDEQHSAKHEQQNRHGHDDRGRMPADRAQVRQ